MDQELKQRISDLEAKVDAVYKSVEKTRKYFLVIIWVTVLGLVLPMIGLAFVLPSFINNYVNTLGGLGL